MRCRVSDILPVESAKPALRTINNQHSLSRAAAEMDQTRRSLCRRPQQRAQRVLNALISIMHVPLLLSANGQALERGERGAARYTYMYRKCAVEHFCEHARSACRSKAAK
jgi:hypothetical protein